MGYVGTCWVCGLAIWSMTDLAWFRPRQGMPRKRVHRDVCLAAAQVQSTPKIEGSPME